ncbi:phage-related tail protein [Nitratiruptor sp. SB155-2]|nr:phage-related tail protein [Nitratiruptor sp. SB155-2]BAN05354.1 tail fiber protein [Nitratiruptor phage NrS-1]
MTQLPTLTVFSGQVPDKTTMDKDTFANSVHIYLNYFNDSFVPETNTLVDNMNTLSGEVQTAADNAAVSATNAATSEANAVQSATNAATSEQNAATSEANAANSASAAANSEANAATSESNAAQSATNAANSEQKAFKWANEDEDIEVEPGQYSAKHWAAKAAYVVSNGVIDDTSVSTITTYSSQMIEDRLQEFASTASVIDGGTASSTVDAIIDGGGASNA